jgi:hypothetical protein
MRMQVLALAAMVLVGVTAHAADHTGVPRIVDGDTLVIGGRSTLVTRLSALTYDVSEGRVLIFIPLASFWPP